MAGNASADFAEMLMLFNSSYLEPLEFMYFLADTFTYPVQYGLRTDMCT